MTTIKAQSLGGLLALGLLLFGAPAQAATGVSVQRFEPAMHTFSQLRTESAKISREYKPNIFLFFNHSVEPTPALRSGATDLTPYNKLTNLGTMNLVGSISVDQWFSAGLDIPFHIYRGGGIEKDVNGNPTFTPSGFTIGDVRLSVKGGFRKPTRKQLGVGLQLDVGVPSGGDNAYTDEDGAWLEPKILLEERGERIRVLYNGGMRLRLKKYDTLRKHRYQQEMRHQLGVGVLPDPDTDSWEITFEAMFATSLDYAFDDFSNYLEGTVGVKYTHPGSGLMVAAGGGAAMGGDFFRGYGGPNLRIVGVIGWQPELYWPDDTDGDGYEDDDDGCPDDAEDFDEFEDHDGCPDLDNDKDGVLDLVDECPLQPEDMDGVDDDDGCPDGDSDNDGIDDSIDKCAMQPEDPDGFQDEDGCPELDNDNDGIPDYRDQICPNDPEDMDGIADDDGCPEDDADADGIPDVSDGCPTEAENLNGCEDTDGCPEAKRVCVSDKAIVITDKVYFASGRNRILRQSYDLIEEIAGVMLHNPQIEIIEIGGHTDDKGSARGNQRLSEKRAKAVYKRLISLGVPKDRLTFKGYGEDNPIADNGNAEGRATNRRVEFIIVKQRKE